MAVIAGPTASGKSALALALAEAANGVIVNADSAQIYADLPILSATPGPEELKRVDHRLYGGADGSVAMSAADWAQLAKRELAEIHARGRLPILAGGTGLYLRTLIEGIAPVPPIDVATRAEVRANDVARNRERLLKLDPRAAGRLGATDSARIARALEVVLSTGRPLAEWQEERTEGIGNAVELRPLVLLPPRDWIYRRCDARFATMIEGGAVEEVRRLLERDLSPSLPVMRAIGVREIAAFLRGECSLDQAIASGQQATRNYAKRQYTWFTHQPPEEWRRFAEPLDALATIESACAILRST